MSRQTLRIKAAIYPEVTKYYHGGYMNQSNKVRVDWHEFCPLPEFFGRIALMDAASTEPNKDNNHKTVNLDGFGFVYENSYWSHAPEPFQVKERRYYFYVDEPYWVIKGEIC